MSAPKRLPKKKTSLNKQTSGAWHSMNPNDTQIPCSSNKASVSLSTDELARELVTPGLRDVMTCRKGMNYGRSWKNVIADHQPPSRYAGHRIGWGRWADSVGLVTRNEKGKRASQRMNVLPGIKVVMINRGAERNIGRKFEEQANN